MYGKCLHSSLCQTQWNGNVLYQVVVLFAAWVEALHEAATSVVGSLSAGFAQ